MSVLRELTMDFVQCAPPISQKFYYAMLVSITPWFMWDLILKCKNAPSKFKCSSLMEYIPVTPLTQIIEECLHSIVGRYDVYNFSVIKF